MNAKYFYISSMETNKKGHRFAYCSICDENQKILTGHFLSDVFHGKERRCTSIENKWQKMCERAGLIQIFRIQLQETK